MQKEVWFKRKKNGWGWVPSHLNGWVSLGVYTFLMMIYPVVSAPLLKPGTFLAIAAVLTAGLFGLCMVKGEKPSWNWGHPI